MKCEQFIVPCFFGIFFKNVKSGLYNQYTQKYYRILRILPILSTTHLCNENYHHMPVVAQIHFYSEFDLGHSQIDISISDFPNRTFRFGNIHVRNMIYVPNPIWDIPNRIWNTVGFGTLGVLNLTMFQINISTFGSWLGFGYVIPNPTMIQTYLC